MNGFPQSKAEWDSYMIARVSSPNGPCPPVPDYLDKSVALQHLIHQFVSEEVGK